MSSQADFTIANPQELSSPGGVPRMDAVVTALVDDRLPTACEALMKTAPWIKVLAIGVTGRRFALFEMQPTATELGELRATEIPNALRRALT